MCFPIAALGLTALQTGGLALGAVGVGVQAYGAKKEAEAQNASLQYNAELLNRNAAIENQRAASIAEQGQAEEEAQRRQIAKLKGQQTAAFGASGASVLAGGSVEDVLASTAAEGERDILNTRYNTANAVYGSNLASANLTNQASLKLSQQRSPGAAFGTSLLSGASRLGSSFLLNT